MKLFVLMDRFDMDDGQFVYGVFSDIKEAEKAKAELNWNPVIIEFESDVFYKEGKPE